MVHERFYNEKMVEHRAAEALARFSMKSSKPVALPVPVERIAEDLFELNILWEPIPELPGQTVLAGLAPVGRLIVFNEARRSLFDDTPFLYRTVLGHELGHWQLHVDHVALDHPLLPGFERPFQFVCRRDIDSWEERHAHWFTSYLLLPRDLLPSRLVGTEIRSLVDMYRLRDEYQVTITVMRIALERMGWGYVDEDGRVHPSKQEYLGQQRLL